MDAYIEKAETNDDRATGIRIVKRALEEPLRQIANNSGEEGSVVVIKVKELEQDFGFNAQEEKYQDLVKAGIIDPTKVVRTALQNAASIAALMLTTEALVSEIPEERPRARIRAGLTRLSREPERNTPIRRARIGSATRAAAGALRIGSAVGHAIARPRELGFGEGRGPGLVDDQRVNSCEPLQRVGIVQLLGAHRPLISQ